MNSKEHTQNEVNQKELPQLKKYFSSFIKIEAKLNKKYFKNQKIKCQGRSHLLPGFIKSTDHRPTDHRPTDHRPLAHHPPTHRPPTHRPTDRIPTDPTDKILFKRLDNNRKVSILQNSKQLGKC